MSKYFLKASVIVKVEKVILSCTNLTQLAVADHYFTLWSRQAATLQDPVTHRTFHLYLSLKLTKKRKELTHA